MSSYVRSLRSGSTASARRAYFGTAVNGAPGVSDQGLNTLGSDYLHVMATSEQAGGTFDLTLWGKHQMTGQWAVITWFGTGGSVSVDDTGNLREPLLISGLEEIYCQFTNFAGSAQAAVWLGGSVSGPVA
jgi:hypothetical protein